MLGGYAEEARGGAGLRCGVAGATAGRSAGYAARIRRATR